MFLANTMAHLVEENHLGRLFTKEIGEKKVKNTFMKIKAFCIKELIKCRKNGEIILIEKVKEIYSDTDVYYIAIPGYLEPFGVHTNSIKTINEQFDELDFYDYKISKMDNLHTVFPLKVLTEKEKIIRKYMDPRIAQPYELEKIRDRLLWYLKTQDRFEEIKRGKREMKEEQDKKTTRNRKPEKAEKFKEINRDFLERLNEQLGGVIGPTMMDKFLNRASYSFEDFINKKLKAIANPFLEDKDLDESQMNKELLKIFIYIRMFSKISMIKNSRIDDENSIELVKEALKNYEKAFEFMQNNKDKNLSYEDMKKNIQNYLENKEVVKEEFEPELEEQQEYESKGNKPKLEEQEDYEAEESEPKSEGQQITESQEQNDVNPDWDELKKIDESIKDAKEKKANAKKSIDELKEWRYKINDSIKKYEDKIDQLTQSDENKDTIIKAIKELRILIKEQKSLRREIKLEIKRYKLQKQQAKYTIKENRSRKGEIFDRL